MDVEAFFEGFCAHLRQPLAADHLRYFAASAASERWLSYEAAAYIDAHRADLNIDGNLEVDGDDGVAPRWLVAPERDRIDVSVRDLFDEVEEGTVIEFKLLHNNGRLYDKVWEIRRDVAREPQFQANRWGVIVYMHLHFLPNRWGRFRPLGGLNNPTGRDEIIGIIQDAVADEGDRYRGEPTLQFVRDLDLICTLDGANYIENGNDSSIYMGLVQLDNRAALDENWGRSMPYLTKSRYLTGLQCPRRLWLTVHEPPVWAEPTPGSIQDIGQEVGRKAHLLFPGGVLVDEPPWDHAAAVARTQALMADRSVPAIFEAAFEHDGIRVRVDVVERLKGGWWGLREVKSSGGVKDHYRDDVAVQAYVLKGAGVRLSSIEVIHIDTTYVRGKRGIAWKRLFARVDVKADILARLDAIPDHLAEQWTCLRKRKEPVVEPGRQCGTPVECDYWGRCTAGKPEDWVFHLPRLGDKRLADLTEQGIEAISAIPENFPLTHHQATIRRVLIDGRPFVADDLGRLLLPFAPPAYYLDFEAMGPAIPLYPGTRPYQPIPFQWSLHRLDKDGSLRHWEFLATGDEDPRRRFAETLVAAIGDSDLPILVYSSYEQSRLNELRNAYPDLAPGLDAIIARLKDLLVAVRNGVYHRDFKFRNSIKTVAPALCPGFGYGDLDGVADGAAASAAFVRLASGDLDSADADKLRAALLVYCERDTLAMVEAHRALIRLAASA